MTQPPHGSAASFYRERLESLTARIQELESTGRALILRRFVVFLVALGTWVTADFVPQGTFVRTLALLIVAGFVLLVRQHRRVRRELTASRAALRWVESGLARLARDWDRLPAPPSPAPAGHPWAADLDLFGHASLASLLGPVHTPRGQEVRASWLLEPSDPESTADRQSAVRELSASPELLEAVGVESELASERKAPEGGAQFRTFLDWCHRPAPVPPLLAAAGWILPLLLAVFAAGHLAGVLPPRWWVLTLFVQAGIAFRWGSRQHSAFGAVSDGVRGLSAVPPLLEIWEQQPVKAPRLVRERDRLHAEGEPASAAIRRLRRLVHLADMRLSDLYPVFSVGLLWDVHLAGALERWRARHGARVAGWFESLGTLEALSSLAVLAHDNPSWCWPDTPDADEGTILKAHGLGHPLLPPEVCVGNDVEVGPPGSVLLVTGSNMSGKSTLLRSIGLAVVLSEAGAPVCADGFRAPAVRLRTSMRVQDSIESGVSFFMAELLRLKEILDAASEPGRPVLYLVDEILQGTNSEERQAASRNFIRHLLRGTALGAVTTHDLELHRHPEVEEAARMVHFREVVAEDGSSLSFDYLLRPGLATTRNALLLAERVGITDPGDRPRRG